MRNRQQTDYTGCTLILPRSEPQALTPLIERGQAVREGGEYSFQGSSRDSEASGSIVSTEGGGQRFKLDFKGWT